MGRVLAFFLCFAPMAMAFEGMWMPMQLPQLEKQLKEAGLKLDPKNLTKLTEFPMGAVVSLGNCSASFVSPQGLVVTNHHCIYTSLGHNSKPERDLIANGFAAPTLADELPAAPGSRILVTVDVSNVTTQVITPKVDKLRGLKRFDAIEAKQKEIVAGCEKDKGHRCTVASFYGGLEFYLIKQLEIRDVRLVYAPPAGVGKFGGDTDNWMWPRHTGDFGFYRAYVSKDGKAVDYAKDNVPYKPKHVLKISKAGVKEGDFMMVLGYPGRTNRHRLPSEVAYTFQESYPSLVKFLSESLKIIADVTKDNADAKIKYAGQVASFNNGYKNRKGMLDTYAGSDFLARKTAEHDALKKWVNENSARKKEYGVEIARIEKLLKDEEVQNRRLFFLNNATPRPLRSARTLYRMANEKLKPDAKRKAGYQERDLPMIKSALTALERNYDPKVDRALVSNFMAQYKALPASERNAAFDAAVPSDLEKLYQGATLTDTKSRLAWLDRSVDEFKKSDDPFIKIAVSLYSDDLKQEAEQKELEGEVQQAYATYMRAKLAFMKAKGRAVYPDANSTLRVSFGNVKGREPGSDGTNWKAFTTLNGVMAKATGEGDFNAPANQLSAIRARDFGDYEDKTLGTVPVNLLATLDITGGNSGSAALNANAELVGLAFDGTLDSIISDWDFNERMVRTIVCDARYMLWQMEKVDKVTHLLKEMGVL